MCLNLFANGLKFKSKLCCSKINILNKHINFHLHNKIKIYESIHISLKPLHLTFNQCKYVQKKEKTLLFPFQYRKIKLNMLINIPFYALFNIEK